MFLYHLKSLTNVQDEYKRKKVHSFFVPQADQIVAKLMMNMAAVDRRLADEASRQNLVSHRFNGVCKISKRLERQ